MTPALSILCAVLAVIAGLGIRATFIYHGGMMEAYKDLRASRDEAADLRRDLAIYAEGSDKDAALLAEANALLHDTAARGKDARWLPWSERRAAWVKKCEVRG